MKLEDYRGSKRRARCDGRGAITPEPLVSREDVEAFTRRMIDEVVAPAVAFLERAGEMTVVPMAGPQAWRCSLCGLYFGKPTGLCCSGGALEGVRL